jgi:hypothetical protein
LPLEPNLSNDSGERGQVSRRISTVEHGLFTHMLVYLSEAIALKDFLEEPGLRQPPNIQVDGKRVVKHVRMVRYDGLSLQRL